MVAIPPSLRWRGRLRSKTSNRSTTFIVLGFLIGVAFALNLLLVAADNRPPPWDYATYLIRSLAFYNAIKTGSLSQFISVFNEPYRPPLVPLMALPFYALLGTSYRSAMLVNLVFIAILALSTYKLGDTMHSPQFGLVATTIVTTVPGTLAYARVFNIDFPTVALVAAGAYAVIASNGFDKRGMSLLAGVLFGFGMLTKWSYLAFLAPIVVAEAILHRRKIGTVNLVLGGILAVLLSATWYVNAAAQSLINQLVYYAWGPTSIYYSQTENPYGISAFLYYPNATYTYIIGWVYSIALVPLAILSIALLLLVRNRKKRRKKEKGGNRREKHEKRRECTAVWSLACALLFATIAFTMLVDKQPRYFLPALVLIVPLLLSAGWRIHQRLGPLLMIAIAIAGISATAVGALQPAIEVRLGLYEPGTVSQTFIGYSDYSPPKPFDWKVEQMIELIGSLNPEAKVGILTSHWVFNQDTFYYYALRMGFGGLHFYDYRDTQLDGANPYLLLYTFNFVLMKTGDLGETWNTSGAKLVVERLDNASDPFYHSFRSILTLELPDGSQLSIFMKILQTNKSPVPPQNSLIVPQTEITDRYRDTKGCPLKT